MDNVSVITVFTLTGLDYSLEQRLTLFSLTLLWYALIIFVNVSVIVIIIMDEHLHEPMYIFLCNLCFNGLYGTAGFYPKFLSDLVTSHVISYTQCMLQGFVIHSSNCGDLSILALMAYDRYVAICRPLTYHSVMTKQRICIFVFLSWFMPCYGMFMNSVSLVGVTLCGSHINRLYCVNWMIVQLACSPPSANQILGCINITFYFAHTVFIIWSYIYLVKSCLASKDKMGKFIQTCVPHLISVVFFTIGMMIDVLYMRYGAHDLDQSIQNFLSMEVLMIPPLMNPLIYGFKLTKIRNRILSFFPASRTNEGCTVNAIKPSEEPCYLKSNTMETKVMDDKHMMGWL